MTSLLDDSIDDLFIEIDTRVEKKKRDKLKRLQKAAAKAAAFKQRWERKMQCVIRRRIRP